MKKISVWFAAVLILTAILVTFLTTTWLDRCYLSLQRDKLTEAADLIESSYVGQVDRDAMTDAAISAMVDSLNDQWSYYLTAEQLEQYRAFERNQYEGLGLVVKSGEVGGVVVFSVYRGSPAGEAGILPGSRILSVNGNDAENATLEEAMTLVSAAMSQGTVQLVLRTPEGQDASYELQPGTVETEPVSWDLLPDGLGYIRIRNFEDRCGETAVQAVEELRSQGAKGLIFDVRDNPGGQLRQLLQILDHLLPEGVLFVSKDKQGRIEEETSDEKCVQMPMAVLVNSGSYSAAEFFAAALQEYEWAVILGEQTSGKGYAQVTQMLRDGSALHISTLEYVTPKGKSLAGVGLTPDQTVELSQEKREKLSYEMLAYADDDQLEAARRSLRGKIGN